MLGVLGGSFGGIAARIVLGLHSRRVVRTNLARHPDVRDALRFSVRPQQHFLRDLCVK